MSKIKSIQVGTGETCVFYTTERFKDNRCSEEVTVDKITEVWKQVAAEYNPVGQGGQSGTRHMLVYHLFKGYKQVAEIESGCGVILTYWEE